ncbi:MAG: YncE family protein [Candidatus Limnocylindria bacterium]
MSLRIAAFLASAALVIAGCSAPAAAPSPQASPSPSPVPSATPQAVEAEVFLFSNSSPNVTVIDGQTFEVVRTKDLPDFKAWTWNDDNNYFDGQNIWLGHRDPETSEAEVILLDADTLEVTDRIAVGKEAATLYIGKPTPDGQLFVAKHAAWELAVIDIKTHELLRAIDVDVNAGETGQPPRWAACDSDAATSDDGITRIYVPSNAGTTTVAIDAATGEPLQTLDHPAGTRPCMLTVSPDEKVWVQECDGNANVVLDPVSLEILQRIPSGKGPIVAAFTVNGKYGLIGHSGDTVVQVVDAKTFAEVKRIEVGTNPDKVSSHPNGRWVFAELSKEAAVAVIDTSSWTVAQRVPIGTNPTGIFVRTLP